MAMKFKGRIRTTDETNVVVMKLLEIIEELDERVIKLEKGINQTKKK